ncbi:MAG: hypothetical protein WBG67_17140 [Thermoanaerobaculia bacterium]
MRDLFEGFDLERDLPTTFEDVRALRRVEQAQLGIDFVSQVENLSDALPESAKGPRSRTFAGYAKFEL